MNHLWGSRGEREGVWSSGTLRAGFEAESSLAASLLSSVCVAVVANTFRQKASAHPYILTSSPHCGQGLQFKWCKWWTDT